MGEFTSERASMLRAWCSVRAGASLHQIRAASHPTLSVSVFQHERQGPAFLQKRQKSRNPENVQNRHVPYGATLRGESEHMRKLSSEGWKAEKEQIIVDHDPFMAERFHKQVADQLREAEDFAVSQEQTEDSMDVVRDRVEKQLDEMGIPTVSEDFNTRQSLHGNYARGTPYDDIRSTMNRSERLAGIPSYANRPGPLSEAEIRLLRRSRTIPEIAFLMKHAEKSSIHEVNEQYKSALKSVHQTMNDPQSVAEAQQPQATFSRFDISSMMSAREANEALVDSVRLAAELRPEAGEEGDLQASQTEQPQLESGDAAPATEDVLTDAFHEDPSGDIANASGQSATSTEKSATGLESLRAHLNRRYQIVSEDSYSLKNTAAENSNAYQVYARDDWETRDPRHVNMDQYTPREDADPQDRRSVQQIRTEFDLIEEQPYQASMGARALDMGRPGDYSRPDSYTEDQARVIQGRLYEVEANKASQAQEPAPATMQSQLDFLDDLDYEKDLADALRNKDTVTGSVESQESASALEAESGAEDAVEEEDDNVGELQRILQDENYEKKQEEELAQHVAERRKQFRMPDYSNFDIEGIVAEGGSVKQVENSLYEFLLGEKPAEVLEDDIFYNHIPSEVLPAKEFLRKMRDAFGDSPPAHVYDEGIVAYVRSEHLREAMHLFADMKKYGLTPSEESYASVVEGFYLNFDILGGDHLSQEMKQTYPSSTPPSLEVVTGLQDPRHSLDA